MQNSRAGTISRFCKNFLFNEFRINSERCKRCLSMSKKKDGKKEGAAPQKLSVSKDLIVLDKSNNILINVFAKPGAKQNSITGITDEGIAVQINAPPSDGEANTELVKYIASVIGVRKGDVALFKGFKSRQKTLKIVPDHTTLEHVKKKISEEIE